MELVRLNIGVPKEMWRKLRDLAEEQKGKGKASVDGVIRGILSYALNAETPRPGSERVN